MTNSKFHIISFLLSLLLLIACSPVIDGESELINDGENAWLTVSVSLPSYAPSASRADISDKDNDDLYEGTISEQKVSSARIVLYDSQNMVLYALDITSIDVLGGQFASPFVLKARSFKKEDLEVLVLLNPTEKVKAVTNKGNTKSQFEAVATESVNNLASSEGIFMCNASGYTKTTDANWKRTQQEAEAPGAPVSVRVERSVAKIFVSPKAETAIPAENGTATMRMFGLDIINKKIYWMRRPGQCIVSVGTITTPASLGTENPTTPAYYQYAIDPNMGTFNSSDHSQFWYYNEEGMFSTSTGGFDDDKGLYVTENTMTEESQRGFSTTRILFNIQYLPASLTFNNTDKSWANYKGKLMTLNELKEKIASSTSQTDEEMEMPEGFKKDMGTLGISDFTRSFEKNNLKFYYNGENYYTTYIRHFDDGKQPMKMAYGRYGVVRNHAYKIEIAKIWGPGSPLPPQPEDEPNDQEKQYIAVNILVSPWTIRKQTDIILE